MFFLFLPNIISIKINIKAEKRFANEKIIVCPQAFAFIAD